MRSNETFRFAAPLSAGILAMATCSDALASVFSNGSFESPVVPSGSTVLSNGASLGPWSVSIPTGAHVALIRDFHEGLTPFDGAQLLNFNGGDHAPGGSVLQDFDTVTGIAYSVSFAAGRLGPAPGSMGVRASAIADPSGSSNVLASLEAFALGSQGDWTTYAFQFTATGAVTRLRFDDISLATISVDVSLDAVQVSVVPAPSATALCCIAGSALFRRRRR